MPRRTGEVLRLREEWYNLVQVARQHYIRNLTLSDGRTVRVIEGSPNSWRMSREEARDRVLRLRERIAVFTVSDESVVSIVPAFDQNFGIELENYMPRGMSDWRMAELISEQGVTCRVEGNPHIRAPYWTIVFDGSLHASSGIEVRSPFPPLRGEQGLAQVRKVCSILSGQGCRVTKKTGLHIHVDARGKPVEWFKNVYRIYKKWERAIDSFLAPSRRGSGMDSYFCQDLSWDKTAFDAATTFAQVCNAVRQPGSNWRSSARYKKLNFLSFMQFGTVEFRQHQGTVEPEKTEMWIRLLLKMCDKANAALDLNAVGSSLEELLAFLELDGTETTYFTRRCEEFAARQGAML